jgi:hypothetical protein
VDVIFATDAFVLDSNGKELQCQPPLVRVRDSASLFIKIREDWHPQSPWTQIILANGEAVTLDVVMIANADRKYPAGTIGSASGRDGKFIEIRFDPQIPADAKIRSIILEASSPISVETVSWHNFDPL